MFPPTKRLNYFDHQFLRVDDFADEQAYHLGMRRAHNRLLHSPGVAQGLAVTHAGSTLTVSPGVALDGQGREIVLKEPVELAAPPDAQTAWVTIAYDERLIEPTTETGAAGDRRREEAPTVEVDLKPPTDPETRLVLARVTLAGGRVTGVDDGVATLHRLVAGPAPGAELEVRSLAVQGSASVGGTLAVEQTLSVGGAEGGATLNLPGGRAGGDLRVGTGDNRLDVSVGVTSTAGGTARLRAEGTAPRLVLGAAGTDVLTVQDGRVGVGTNAPEVPLHVIGTRLRLQKADGDKYLDLRTDGDELDLHATGGALFVHTGYSAEPLHLNAFGGNVGVGTGMVPPTARLQVVGGNGDLSATEGDFKVGDDAHRLKVGITTAGTNAGDVRVRAVGGTGRLMLGAGTRDVLTVQAGGVGIGAAPAAGVALAVNGVLDATELRKNGAPVVSSQWSAATGGIAYMDGRVGVGTSTPQVPLHVVGEYIRLQHPTMDKHLDLRTNGSELDLQSTGGALFVHTGFSGEALHLNAFGGNVGVGTGLVAATARLQVAGGNGILSTTEGDFKVGDDTYRLKVGIITTGAGAGNVRMRAVGGTGRLMLGAGGTDKISITETAIGFGTTAPSHPYHFVGEENIALFESTSDETYVRLYTREGPDNRVEFCNRPGGRATIFVAGAGDALYVERDGRVFVPGRLTAGTLALSSGAKPGFVIDHFVNRAGDTLEQGDVVVIGEAGATEYWATGNAIPIPEVDLSIQAYDRRVCGIVDSVVTQENLPHAEPRSPAKQPARTKGRRGKQAEADTAEGGAAAAGHPLAGYAAPGGEGRNPGAVGPGQLGSMVTLGAYAHCKVDADIAAIEVGDLLTSSPTRGHAQKVLDPAAAVGAIVGKALAPLRKGRGKIPVMVLLQ